MPLLTEDFGNPSSAHGPGRRARPALDEAHERACRAPERRPSRDRLHGGRHRGDQSRHQGRGLGRQGDRQPHRDDAVEHHAPLTRCSHLEKFGFEVTVLPVDRYGRVDPESSTPRSTTHHPGLAPGRQQRGRHGPPPRDLSRRVRRIRGRRRSSTSTPSRRPRTSPSTSRPSMSTSSPSRPTSSRGPRAWGRSGCARHGDPAADPRWRPGALPTGGDRERGRCGGHGRRPRAQDRERRRPCRASARRDRLRGALATDAVSSSPVTRATVCRATCRSSYGASTACDRRGARPGGHRRSAGGVHDRLARGSHVLAAMGYPDDEARGALRFTLGRTTTEAEVERAAEVVPATSATASGSRAMAADPLGQEIGSERGGGPRVAVDRAPSDGRRPVTGGSWWRCPAASIRLSRRRCSTIRASRRSASGCACTTSPTATASSRRAAARWTPGRCAARRRPARHPLLHPQSRA